MKFADRGDAGRDQVYRDRDRNWGRQPPGDGKLKQIEDGPGS
jgi:hypothetical protein